jgi:hypothetical protein
MAYAGSWWTRGPVWVRSGPPQIPPQKPESPVFKPTLTVRPDFFSSFHRLALKPMQSLAGLCLASYDQSHPVLLCRDLVSRIFVYDLMVGTTVNLPPTILGSRRVS